MPNFSLSLSFTVICSLNVTARVQNGSSIISLHIQNANMSHGYIKCLQSDNGKVLFFMQNGEKQSSHQQFKGRVQYRHNSDVVDLELSNFSKDDAGTYTCNFSDGKNSGSSELTQWNFADLVNFIKFFK